MHQDPRPSPIGDAMTWATRIIAAGLVMFMPAVLGNWLDARWGTKFLGLVGLAFGFVTGMAWLVRVAERKP
jgi:F0F1-type ATP synthase assembly protein I